MMPVPKKDDNPYWGWFVSHNLKIKKKSLFMSLVSRLGLNDIVSIALLHHIKFISISFRKRGLTRLFRDNDYLISKNNKMLFDRDLSTIFLGEYIVDYMRKMSVF